MVCLQEELNKGAKEFISNLKNADIKIALLSGNL
jgi:hypothetical protein